MGGVVIMNLRAEEKAEHFTAHALRDTFATR